MRLGDRLAGIGYLVVSIGIGSSLRHECVACQVAAVSWGPIELGLPASGWRLLCGTGRNARGRESGTPHGELDWVFLQPIEFAEWFNRGRSVLPRIAVTLTSGALWTCATMSPRHEKRAGRNDGSLPS